MALGSAFSLAAVVAAVTGFMALLAYGLIAAGTGKARAPADTAAALDEAA